MPLPAHIGGSFGPPLSDEKLEEYHRRIDALPSSAVKDALNQLLPCCHKWWELPEPNHDVRLAHPSGRGTIVPLHAEHKEILDELIPWGHELEAIQRLFDSLPTGASHEEFVEVTTPDGKPARVRQSVIVYPEAKALRDMAFHLLWHVKELDVGREPLTTDKLL